MVRASYSHQVIRTLIGLFLASAFLWAGNQQFPKAKVQELNGRRVDMEKMMTGKLTLVNFWATYCVPCRKEMKILDRFNSKYAKQDFQVLGVAIDNSKTVGRVRGLVRSQKLDYTILLDTDQNLYRTFKTNAMPYSVLVNPQGEIVWEHTGYLPGDEVELEKVLQAQLKLEAEGSQTD